MKNNILKALMILALPLSSLASCSHLLDAEDDGRTDYDAIFANRAKIQTYCGSCLSAVSGPDLRSMAYCDEAQTSALYEDDNTKRWYNGDITAGTHHINPFGGDPWSAYYALIRRCNIFLSRIDGETAGLNPDEKDGYKAEVYGMRGYYYWQLAKRYGDVPVFTYVIPSDHDFSADVKTPFHDVVRQVIADCEAALETGPDNNIGYPWGYIDRLSGRLNRAGVHAVMSQAATYAVSPLWYGDGGFTREYATRITGRALYECLSHGYELFTETSAEAVNAYALYFLTTDNQRAIDKETIYKVGGQMPAWKDYGLPSTSGQTSAGYCPSQNLVDCYEMQATGLPAVNGYSDAAKTVPIVNAASGYDPANPYAGRDPRLEASIYYNGAKRYLDGRAGTVQTYVGGADGYREINDNKRYTPTGYYMRKYAHYDSRQGTNRDGSMRLFRLAELYLNFAETACRSHGPDVQVEIGAGMRMSARDAVNAVRSRAGMPGFPAGMTADEFEARYRNERRVELAFEGHRPFDVRRWRTLADETSVTGMKIEKSGDVYTYTRFVASERKANTDKFLIFPINLGELNKIRAQTGQNWQNPGWDD